MVFDKRQYEKSTNLIIPCVAKDIYKLKSLLEKLGANKFFLKKTIVIFNDINNKSKEDLVKSIKTHPDHLIITRKKRLNPGEARNIGLDNSTEKYIAFLDVSTIPEDQWLEKTLKLIITKKINGVLGNTKYIYKTSFEKSFIAATYGENYLRTVPGGVFKRKFLQKVGYFLPNLKSGEDKEWTHRFKQLDQKIYFKNYSEIYYNGIINKNFKSLSKKWFDNYSNFAHDYSIEIERQRFIYLSFFSCSIIILARFWNNIAASWDESSIFYIPNITKISLALIIITYLITRFIILTKKKNIKFKNYTLIEIINFVYIGMVLDLIKLIAFITTIIRKILYEYKLFFKKKNRKNIV